MDVVDEQLDTIGKAFLGQTIGCARCHDHKFDPIPTRDYYAMAGILRNSQSLEHANVSKWMEVPLPLPAGGANNDTPQYEASLPRWKSGSANCKARSPRLAGAGKATPTCRKLSRVKDLPGIIVDDEQAKQVGDWKESQHIKRLHRRTAICTTITAAKGEKTLTFVPALPASGRYEVRLAYTLRPEPRGKRAGDRISAPTARGHWRSTSESRRRSTGGSFRWANTTSSRRGRVS